MERYTVFEITVSNLVVYCLYGTSNAPFALKKSDIIKGYYKHRELTADEAWTLFKAQLEEKGSEEVATYDLVIEPVEYVMQVIYQDSGNAYECYGTGIGMDKLSFVYNVNEEVGEDPAWMKEHWNDDDMVFVGNPHRVLLEKRTFCYEYEMDVNIVNHDDYDGYKLLWSESWKKEI